MGVGGGGCVPKYRGLEKYIRTRVRYVGTGGTGISKYREIPERDDNTTVRFWRVCVYV